MWNHSRRTFGIAPSAASPSPRYGADTVPGFRLVHFRNGLGSLIKNVVCPTPQCFLCPRKRPLRFSPRRGGSEDQSRRTGGSMIARPDRQEKKHAKEN